jgi:hypothetical protein
MLLPSSTACISTSSSSLVWFKVARTAQCSRRRGSSMTYGNGSSITTGISRNPRSSSSSSSDWIATSRAKVALQEQQLQQ